MGGYVRRGGGGYVGRGGLHRDGEGWVGREVVPTPLPTHPLPHPYPPTSLASQPP